MMENIRLATPEEIQAIADQADLTTATNVVAFEKSLVVLRNAFEIDPVFFDPEMPKNKRSLLLWTMEQIFRFNGLPAYYFNVKCEDEDFINSVKQMGCEQTSTAPEFRFRKLLR